MRRIVVTGIFTLMVSGCKSTPPTPQAKPAVPVQPAVSSGINLSQFDTSVRPQNDLYRYVNGTWLKNFEIPPDKSNYGAFTQLHEEAQEKVRTIIEDTARQKPALGTDAQKVGDLYNSFMDKAQRESLGIKPLAPAFEQIDAINSLADLSEYIGYAQIYSTAPFAVYVSPDAKLPDTYITNLVQSGIGLPEREYYLSSDDKSQTIRDAYIEHIAKTLALAEIENAEAHAQSIFELETQMAKAHWTKETNRDPLARYNKTTMPELQQLMPNLDWKRWHKTSMLPELSEVLVAQPDYLQAVNALLTEVSLSSWKLYFKWHAIRRSAHYLSQAMFEESFRFYQGVLSGVETPEPRWQRGVNTINGLLGEIVGKIFVERHFKPEAKQQMVVLVENLRSAYAESIKTLDWMSEETKVQALDKLQKFTPKIGYPDKWKDYSELSIDPQDLYGNIQRAITVLTQQNRAKLGQPVDRGEWFMTPQTVNAYYNPVMNEIVFPAAILQPPFFNLEADDAVNYGGIGAVIGHEMGHGFDDQGSSYDGDGKLRNWWTEQDQTEFRARTNALVAQYDNFTVLDNVNVNGEFTLGENIGDLGGLSIAYKAYKMSLKGQTPPVIDNFTGPQRVFIGWAQVWARKYRDADLLNRIKTNPHSPSEFRANGTVRNIPEFHEAFGTQEGDAMYLAPENRVRIW